MKKLIILALTLILTSCKSEKHSMEQLRNKFGYITITSADDACLAYPKTPEEISKRALEAENRIKNIITSIIQVPHDLQNKTNMIYAFDALDGATFELGILEFVQHVYPDDTMRIKATEASINLRNIYTDMVEMNVDLYKAFKAYNQGNASSEQLSYEERYFLNELLKDFQRFGLDLPEEKRKEITELNKKINKIGQDFSCNISEDTSVIYATKEDLSGISEDFINNLKTNEEGFYVLHMDYPTQDMISNYCTIQETRKRFSKAFKNRAYPKNKAILDDLINTRHQLAHLLGFKSFADLDLDDQMIKNSHHAWNFENDLENKTKTKALQEFNIFTKDLPEGVSLSPEGKLYPWDSGFVMTHFKKEKYNIDERILAEYFPMEKTLNGLMHIYEQFFSIKIKHTKPNHTWHPDVELLELSDASTNEILGYVFLDMYPRPKKYGHAAQFSGITAHINQDGYRNPGVVTVVCNFTKPTTTTPSLLKYNEVNTFFHEFGHALHSILGATHLASQAGTNVKSDFVELPSQMLENWLEDKNILKNLSCHYKTGKHLPDELLDKKLELLKFGIGMQTIAQILYAMVSLEYFGEQQPQDTSAVWKKYSERLMPYSVYDNDSHTECSFGHLVGYGAKYYGYMWSDVLGQDIFAEIKKYGLLNPVIGQKYKDCIIGKGGSKDPNELLVDFLGREPNSNAFFKKMGL